MPVAKNQTAKARTTTVTNATKPAAKTAKPTAKATTSTAAETPAETLAETPAEPTTDAETEKPVQASQTSKPAPSADESGKRISVTIPLDSAVVGVAVKAVTLPVTAAKKVAQNKNGIPAYVAVGGLAVLGAVEWPVAAVGGLSLAALRRWGPLKPEPDQESKKSA